MSTENPCPPLQKAKQKPRRARSIAYTLQNVQYWEKRTAAQNDAGITARNKHGDPGNVDPDFDESLPFSVTDFSVIEE